MAAEVSSVVNMLSVMMPFLSVGITGFSYLSIHRISIPMSSFIIYLNDFAGRNSASQIPEISGDEIVALNGSMSIMLSLNPRVKSDMTMPKLTGEILAFKVHDARSVSR